MNEFKLYLSSEEEANIIIAISNHESYDAWGICEYGNEENAVDYNLCIDNSGEETEYCSAFYRLLSDDKGIWSHDNCQEFVPYEIDFSDKDWMIKLEHAAERAYEELFGGWEDA